MGTSVKNRDASIGMCHLRPSGSPMGHRDVPLASPVDAAHPGQRCNLQIFKFTNCSHRLPHCFLNHRQRLLGLIHIVECYPIVHIRGQQVFLLAIGFAHQPTYMIPVYCMLEKRLWCPDEHLRSGSLRRGIIRDAQGPSNKPLALFIQRLYAHLPA